MLTFFSDCADLFNSVFYAAFGVEIFAFLLEYLIILVCFGLFLTFYRGVRR